MSSQHKRGIAADGVSEEAVAHYLHTHAEFFERHAELLARMRIPHPTGSAVSLVERQVAILRQRNRKLERKLRDLLEVARANDALANKIHALGLKLLAATDLPGMLRVLQSTLREDFGADEARVVLFAEHPARNEDLFEAGLLHRVIRDDPRLEAFASFMSQARCRCGNMQGAQRDFLFGKAPREVSSAALLPLGAKPLIGLLAIGSYDPDRFNPAMSTEYLARIGDLVYASVRRVSD